MNQAQEIGSRPWRKECAGGQGKDDGGCRGLAAVWVKRDLAWVSSFPCSSAFPGVLKLCSGV